MAGVDELPQLGFGTYQIEDMETCIESVQTALRVGYRHIDTAQAYENEAYVGDAIEYSDVPREEICVATKISTENLAYEDVLDAVERSRDRVGLETIDLLYVHWPLNTYDPEDTLRAFDELVERGTIRHVGLSNFRVDQIQEARTILDAPIFAHQVECHPLLPQRELREYAEDTDHHLVAYSPLARGDALEVPAINDVAEEYNATPAQVCLAWLLAKGIYPIPKARGDHIKENYRALELVEQLKPGDIVKIDGVDRRERLIDPDSAPWNQPEA